MHFLFIVIVSISRPNCREECLSPHQVVETESEHLAMDMVSPLGLYLEL